jgi:hypothetical protein
MIEMYGFRIRVSSDEMVSAAARSNRREVLCDRGLADFNTDLQQLAMDARCTPERVGTAHLPDQFPNLVID